MYDELVKRLRDGEHEIDCSLCDRDCCYPSGKVHGKCIIIEAADAIEELGEYANTIMQLKSEGWYLQQTKYRDGYMAIATMPLPEPPKEEEK